MGHVRAETEEEKTDMADLNKDLLRRNEQLAQMEQLLPRESGTYLKGLFINHMGQKCVKNCRKWSRILKKKGKNYWRKIAKRNYWSKICSKISPKMV